jgi:pimeloyl-ACP methyl ester carboxylesterase
MADPRGIALTGAETATSSLLSRLSDNRVPTLLLHGTREQRFAPAAALARERMPQLEVVELDAGHGVNLDAAHEFDRAVCAFIGRASKQHAHGYAT